MPADTSPNLSFVIPGSNENRWSDLLASLIATDPDPIAGIVGGHPDEVEREPVVRGDGRKSDRLDLLLRRGERTVAAIEVKVLSDLGLDQLQRYETSFPGADAYVVLHLAQLPLTLPEPWQSVTWEDVLAVHAASKHPWVAATARAWLDQLAELVPHVDAGTVWNGVPDDAAGFELALRARVAWLSTRMHTWCQIEHDLAMSSGGGSWVVAMRTPAQVPDHWVIAEVQEGMSAQEWRADPANPYSARVRGPAVLLGLAQIGPATSESFDWAFLHQLFKGRVYADNGTALGGRPWSATTARLRDPGDRANWRALVSAGAPSWLGKGYGMATAKTHGVCAFGARLQLPPTLTLGEVETELQELHELVMEMAGSPARAGGAHSAAT
jgi:hypothetical protein